MRVRSQVSTYILSPLFRGSIMLRDVIVGAALFGLAAGLLWPIYGPPAAVWVWPFISLYLSFVIVVIGVGNQLAMNAESGRANEQISWFSAVSNLAANMLWALFGWVSGDLVVVMSRVFPYVTDHIGLYQMLSSARPHSSRMTIILGFLSVPVSLYTAALTAPLWHAPELFQGWPYQLLWSATGAVQFLTVIGSCMQLHRNMKSGVRTAKDFSLKLPVLVCPVLIAWAIRETLEHTSDWLMLITMPVGALANFLIIVQVLYYRWQSAQRDAQKLE